VNVAVLGGGAWGTALAITLASRHRVRLWARDPQQRLQMRSARCNARYLPNFAFPASLEVADTPAEALDTSDLAVLGVTVAGCARP
jgi:glycerol-3-phosphate dehydrogenase (NAD(P)+)